jgi:hypothetical protein
MIDNRKCHGRETNIMNRILSAANRSQALLFAALAVVFLAAPASARVVNNNGQPPYVRLNQPQLQNATNELQNSCGNLKLLARSNNGVGTVIVLKYWHLDKYANQPDPHNGQHYGNHLTVAALDGNKKAGIWHYYQSGAAWVNNSPNPDPEGTNAVYKCNR